jgi:hypothetical protein
MIGVPSFQVLFGIAYRKFSGLIRRVCGGSGKRGTSFEDVFRT